jgi:hypothetical protein
MFHVHDAVDDMTINNTGMLNIFDEAKAAWDEAIRNNATQTRLNEIIQKAREALHKEVWLVDRDMNSPVFRDDVVVPAYIREAEFSNNWDRFNHRIWHPVHGEFRHRPEAPWYRMHDHETMDRMTEHGADTRIVNRHGFINRDYDIVRIHDEGLKQYLRTPENLRRIHEDISWKMTLLNYLASGREGGLPFNLPRYPHHFERLVEEVVPWNLHGRDIRHLRDWYERTRSPLNDVPDEDGDREVFTDDRPAVGHDDGDDDDSDDDDDDDDDDDGDYFYEEGEEEEVEEYDDEESDEGQLVGGSIPRAHMALQSLESRHASSIARQIAYSRR